MIQHRLTFRIKFIKSIRKGQPSLRGIYTLYHKGCELLGIRFTLRALDSTLDARRYPHQAYPENITLRTPLNIILQGAPLQHLYFARWRARRVGGIPPDVRSTTIKLGTRLFKIRRRRQMCPAHIHLCQHLNSSPESHKLV